jgi:hypothetical protein
MSQREAAEQGVCTDCNGGAWAPEPAAAEAATRAVDDAAAARDQYPAEPDDDPCPRCGGDHDRIDRREPCPETL